MCHRVLIECMKFLPPKDLLLSVVQVAQAWRRAVYADEILLFLLGDEESDPTLPLYERFKQQQLDRSPSYLLHVANGKALIWHVSSPEHVFTQVEQVEFTNSSRYALITPTAAVVTGGTSALRRCTLIDLVSLAITTGASLLEDRAWHGTAALNKQVFVSGADISGKISRSAEVFDGVTWKKIADMTIPRYNHTLCVYKATIYAFAGSNATYRNSIEFYDGVKWIFTPMKLLFHENYSDLIYYHGKLILLGGHNSEGAEKRVYVWNEMKWSEVCKKPGEYSLSNAVTIKNELCYFFNHPGNIIAFALSI